MVALAATALKDVVRDGVPTDTISPYDRCDGGMEQSSFHQPVLLRETLEQLVVGMGGVYLDATVGEGGHTSSTLQASAPEGIVLGIDRDPRSLARAIQRLSSFGNRFIPVCGNYAEMVDFARAEGITNADGILLDLGFSSRQVDAEGYGFSFQRDEPLDMRFNREEPIDSAADVINSYAEDELANLIFQYGEEHRSRAVARAIVRNRPIHTTGVLRDLIARTLGSGPGRARRIHPATRTFQALRIAVNRELENLQAGLEAAVILLAPKGRLVVISYHSLEDRLVKTFIYNQSATCICPPELPVCVCANVPNLRIVNRRVIKPDALEVENNSRSRSARMRVVERLDTNIA